MKKLFSTVKTKVLSKKRPLITATLLALVIVGYQNCQQQDQFFVSPTSEDRAPASDNSGGVAPSDESATNPAVPAEEEKSLCADGSTADLICNPLGGGTTTTPPTTGTGGGTTTTPTNPVVDVPAVPASKLGLIAQLYEGQNNWNSMDPYLKEGYKHQEYIYFSNFNVPTRSFTQGFGFSDNEFLKNRNGEKLIEWFAIQAKGNIVLPDSEEPGYYHITTISDDGIRVAINGQRILNNSDIHSPTIDCATTLIQLNAKEEKSFELTYFQGPRTEIALMVLIKKIDDPATFKKGSFCSTGNGPDTLIKNGYKVISPAWFTLPAGF